jgi:hypothetical protein
MTDKRVCYDHICSALYQTHKQNFFDEITIHCFMNRNLYNDVTSKIEIFVTRTIIFYLLFIGAFIIKLFTIVIMINQPLN